MNNICKNIQAPMNQSQCSTYINAHISAYIALISLFKNGFETKNFSDDIHFKKIRGADFPPIRI